MEFRIGERVRFLREKLEGVVIRIQGKDYIVLVDDFDEVEVSGDEIVRISGKEKSLTGSEEAPPPPQLPVHTDIRLATLAICQEFGGEYSVYLLNQGAGELLFALYPRIRKRISGAGSGRIGPLSQQKVFTLSLDEFHSLQEVTVQLLFARLGEGMKPLDPIEQVVPIQVNAYRRKPVHIPELGIDGYVFPLNELTGLDTDVHTPEPPVAKKGITEVAKMEVDLHIEKLVEKPAGLDSLAMLRMQLDTFEKYLFKALDAKLPYVVFIHGVGNGTLKNEIHKRLDENMDIKGYGVADPVKYGNGATKVFLF